MQNSPIPSKNLDRLSDTATHPLVVVKKVIHAEPSDVFNAWASEDLVKQWWGPEGFTCPTAKIDFRVGGQCLCEMKNAEHDLWSVGTFLDIVPNERIVCSDNPANEKGEIVSAEEAGMGPFSDLGEAYITVEFRSINDGSTELTLSHEGLPARMHDECVDGWSSSLDKLKRLVERH